MRAGRLTPLQQRILEVLSGPQFDWVLTGGGALVGFYSKHRVTRDLDLFWRGRRELQELPREVTARLSSCGLTVEALQTAMSFCRLRVSLEGEVCVLDLVADPTPAVEPPVEHRLDRAVIRVDSAREILANKLCALLSRSELRDLTDVRVLVREGLDVETALDDAARKDGGFSPLTLAWVLQRFDVRAAAAAIALSEEETEELVVFKESLIARLLEGVNDELGD